MEKVRNLFTDQELLALRLAGRLPRISIGADDFIVDWSRKELRLEEDATKCISLENLPLTEDGKKYLCFYDPVEKAVITIPENITQMPKGIVLLEIPIEHALDPVGVARSYGQPDTFLLDIYPNKAWLTARIIPVEQSGLPELVRINLEKRKQQGLCRFFKGAGRNKRKI